MTYKSTIAGRSGESFVQEAITEHGPLLDATSVEVSEIDLWDGILPEILLDLWRNFGTGALHKGLLRICKPNDFDGLLSQIFHADSDFSHSDCYVIGYGAFGKLIIWSERHWIVEVDLISSRVTAEYLMTPEDKLCENVSLITGLFIPEKPFFDAFDDDSKPLYSRAVKKLGRPGPGKAFGFAPAIAFGGSAELSNVKIVPALEHFLVLAQLQQFSLYSYLSKPTGLVRMIG